MQIMRMSYNDLTNGGGEAKLHVYGVDTFPVFSGQKPYTNDPNCTYLPNSGIPVGRYWIVDRPEGSLANQLRGRVIDAWNGSNHSEWFALFNSHTMSDHMLVNGVSRGSFRLHPLRPDGSGISEGCITFFRRSDFYTVRHSLLRRQKVRVPGSRSGLMAYGYIDVQGDSNFANCKIR
ncbi:DUF2778 domain-containing protein [Salmonella enterica]|nr:DUF2778 domain-containing protein [Salmonella enterica]EEE0770321.1 DUF2778 domain-containing protein [Salmonella enterica]EEJ2991961.1 DUF2778 domain-containing protein [Salmonella enterica]EIL0493351.1 DUF2778 domain-containing protein [Salmonella enterica]HAE4737094.1 DUF2778 domain-containing protein [Salmonella enterica subsp. houtenae serovar 41:z4,z23:-]